MNEIKDLMSEFVRTFDNDQARVMGQTQHAIEAVAEITLPDPMARGVMLLTIGYRLATEAGLTLDQIFDGMRVWDEQKTEISAAAKRSRMHVAPEPEKETS